MECIICGEMILGEAFQDWAQGHAHLRCIRDFHNDLDEQLIHDMCRCYGVRQVEEWVRGYIEQTQAKLN